MDDDLRRGAWKKKDESAQLQKEMVADRLGIFSASARKDNVLMWSHYAESHKGFCVGFDTKAFENHFENAFRANRENADLVEGRRVRYGSEYPDLDPRNMGDEGIALGPLMFKAERWKYEEEIRFFRLNEAKVPVKLSASVIIEVIMGCNMNKEDRTEITSVVRELLPHAALYQANMKKRSFELEFDPC